MTSAERTTATVHLPGCLIVSGTPGAGKTTATQLVAERLARAARIDGDAVNQMIVTGAVGPMSEPADEAHRQLLLRAHNGCSLANNFAEAGFVPIIDHVVPDRQILDLMIGRLQPRPVLLVVLAPPLEVCEHRNVTRPEEHRVPYNFSVLYDTMRKNLGDVGWWLDTADLSPEETAATILAHAHEKAVVADRRSPACDN